MADTEPRWPDVPRDIADGVYRAAIHWREQARAVRPIVVDNGSEHGTYLDKSDRPADRALAAYLDHRPRPPQQGDEAA
jgi:hypothetical protein